MVFELSLLLNMRTLHTLTYKVASGGHFDLKILVIEFGSLGPSFFSIAKYFRRKKVVQGGEGVRPSSYGRIVECGFKEFMVK